jgi:hypothetical protein
MREGRGLSALQAVFWRGKGKIGHFFSQIGSLVLYGLWWRHPLVSRELLPGWYTTGNDLRFLRAS